MKLDIITYIAGIISIYAMSALKFPAFFSEKSVCYDYGMGVSPISCYFILVVITFTLFLLQSVFFYMRMIFRIDFYYLFLVPIFSIILVAA